MAANDKQVGGQHYVAPIQHWDYVLANNIPYLEAMAIKYIVRHAKKNGKQDLEKAIHFIEKIIETHYSEKEFVPVSQDQGLCPDASNGNHSWSSMYRHGPEGRLIEEFKCDWCGASQAKV